MEVHEKSLKINVSTLAKLQLVLFKKGVVPDKSSWLQEKINRGIFSSEKIHVVQIPIGKNTEWNNDEDQKKHFLDSKKPNSTTEGFFKIKAHRNKGLVWNNETMQSERKLLFRITL